MGLGMDRKYTGTVTSICLMRITNAYLNDPENVEMQPCRAPNNCGASRAPRNPADTTFCCAGSRWCIVVPVISCLQLAKLNIIIRIIRYDCTSKEIGRNVNKLSAIIAPVAQKYTKRRAIVFFWGADPCEIQHSRLFLGIYFYTWLVSNTTKPRKFPNHHRKLVRNRFRHKSLNVPRLHPRPLDSIIEDRTKSHKSTEQHQKHKRSSSIAQNSSVHFDQVPSSFNLKSLIWQTPLHYRKPCWMIRACQSI